jgi:hypothetical protein
MATAPKPGARAQKEADEAVISVTVDGTAHHLRIGELTALDVGALRRATGWTTRHLVQLAIENRDIDVAATLVWLARRQHGEPRLEHEAVAATFTYANDFTFGDTEEEDDDSPEA